MPGSHLDFRYGPCVSTGGCPFQMSSGLYISSCSHVRFIAGKIEFGRRGSIASYLATPGARSESVGDATVWWIKGRFRRKLAGGQLGGLGHDLGVG